MKKKNNSMNIEDIKKLFQEERPENWKDIPDIDLYMDQIINYMERQHIGLKVDENLTGAMVNNYIKQKIMPKANGKKYNRDHIAYLTAICLLKQIMSVSDVGVLLENQVFDKQGINIFYENYISILDENLTEANNLIKESLTKDEAAKLALEMAVSSYVQKLTCECLVSYISDEEKK